MCGEYGQVLAIARELQKVRVEAVFSAGFQLPAETCEKFMQRYHTECRSHASSGQDVYKSLFTQFWAEVRQQILVPEALNHLDLITIFGEICTGERLADGTLIGPAQSRTIH